MTVRIIRDIRDGGPEGFFKRFDLLRCAGEGDFEGGDVHAVEGHEPYFYVMLVLYEFINESFHNLGVGMIGDLKRYRRFF